MMDSNSLYQDIAKRTNGDIYIGVVGPVRSGKSTFLKKFMDELVLPNMTDLDRKQRVIDELPQSADGRSVMTTEPKFVPDMSANIDISEGVNVNVRLIDCVGYMINGVDNQDRQVHTPWSDKTMSFVDAAEMGTRKVMCEHSTIGIVVTTDGSVTDFAREEYVTAEENIVAEMKLSGKPFVILVNTENPMSSAAKNLSAELSIKYGVSVVAKNVSKMIIDDIQELLELILGEFPMQIMHMSFPKWMQMLPLDNVLIQKICACMMEKMIDVNKMRDYVCLKNMFSDDSEIKKLTKYQVKYASGSIVIEIEPKEELFYKVLSEVCAIEIKDESELFGYIKGATDAVKMYDKMKSALESVEESGYGIIVPSDDEIEYCTPEFIENGGKKSVKMDANCTCLHVMKVSVDAKVNPIMATGVQGQEMISYLKSEYEDNIDAIWHTNMLGKELCEIAKDSLSSKMYNIPVDVQNKLRKTVCKIVNEGKGGMLCVLL